MAIRRPDIGCMRTVLVIGALLGGGLGGGVAAAIPAQAMPNLHICDHSGLSGCRGCGESLDHSPDCNLDSDRDRGL
jgi:hypothetical protein